MMKTIKQKPDDLPPMVGGFLFDDNEDEESDDVSGIS